MKRGHQIIRLVKWALTFACTLMLLCIVANRRYGLEAYFQSGDFAQIMITDGVIEFFWEEGAGISALWQRGRWLVVMQKPIIWHQNFFALPNFFRCTGVGEITIPGWVPLILLALPSLLLWRLDRRPPPGHCPRCRYNLTGNTTGVCPECGLPIDRPGSPTTVATPTPLGPPT